MLGDIPGIEEVTLTTNGLLLPGQAQELADAGISRVNLSLDTLRPDRYAEITRCGKLEDALSGLQAAQKAGMRVKLTVVPVRGFNADEIVDLVRITRCGKLEDALSGLQAAQKAGMRVKLTVVPVRGFNADEIVDLVRFGPGQTKCGACARVQRRRDR